MVGQFSKFARLVCCIVVGCLFASTVVRADDDGAILNPTPGSTKWQASKTTEPDSTVARLSGTGRQASDKFNLDSGLVVFKVTNGGDSNFVVRLLDRNGKQIE